MSAGCCSALAPDLRLTPFDCFQRGLATRRLAPLAVRGEPVTGVGDLWASFSVRLAEGRLADVRFDCATCATLVACCQALAEFNRGCALASACVPEAETLWARLPGMPRAKWDRAVLAVAALRAALARAEKLQPVLTGEP